MKERIGKILYEIKKIGKIKLPEEKQKKNIVYRLDL